jgi:glyoxylate reductase
MKPKLWIRRRFEGDDFDRVLDVFDATVLDGPLAPRIQAGEARDVVALWTFGERVDDELLARLPALRAIANHGVGTDTIDRAALTRAGVELIVPHGANADAVADHAMALLLAVRHRVVAGDAFIRAGFWGSRHATEPAGEDLTGATLGIIGLGAIGTETARRAMAFRMRVIYHSRTRRQDLEQSLGVGWRGLGELLAEADNISIHCPLTPETRGMLGPEELAAVKPGAVLVNTARGAVVDEESMIAALESGRLAGAALDVFPAEPHVDPRLIAMPQVVLTPHIADLQEGAMAALTRGCVDGLLRVAGPGSP